MNDAGFDTVVFERHAKVGGIWNIDAPGTPMYRSAHFISSSTHWASHFSGFPFPTGTPPYPSYAQVQAYLEAFAIKENLLPLVEFDTEVRQAPPPRRKGGWHIVTNKSTGTYDALVVCSGMLWDINQPKFNGDFAGVVRHSQTYHSAEEFAGKRVLIVGCGNSGADIACDAARTADAAFLSVRRGYWFLPKFIMGHPTDVFFSDRSLMPTWLSPPDMGRFLESVAGNPSLFGLPEPDHPPLASHPIMSSDVLHHLGHGRLAARGDVERVDKHNVQFKCGEVEHIDEIICATGYRASVPFLPEGLLDYRSRSRPALKVAAFHPSEHDLYFSGMIETNGGVFGLFDRVAAILAKVIQARSQGTLSDAEAKELIEAAHGKTLTEGKITSARHVGYVDTANLVAGLNHLGIALDRHVVRISSEHSLHQPAESSTAKQSPD